MKFKLIIMLLSLSIIVASCNQNNKKQESSNDQLTIGVMASMDYLPLAVAQDRGYFTDNGLDVTIQKFYSPNDRDAALQSNNLDGTIIDYTGGAIQAAGGIPLQFTSQCDGTFEMIVAKESNINSIEDLKSKKIAISRNTVIDFCSDLIMLRANSNSNDAEMVEINKIPLRLEMLNNNKIDAAILPDPFATIAMSEGNRSIINMDSLSIKVTGIIFHQNIIDNKKDALKKLYKAYNQAVKDLQTEPTSNFNELLVKEVGFPPALVANAKLPKYTEAKLPSQDVLATTQTWLQKKNLVPNDFDIRTIVANGIID